MAGEKRRGRRPYGDVLTPAEWRITHAIQHGMTDRQVARRIGVSRDGVKFHVKNTLAKLGLPDRKALRDWFQPPKHSALHRQVTHTMVEANLGPIGQIARSVGDIERAEHWYGKVLGLPHLYTFGNLAFFDCAGTRLMLAQGDSPPNADSVLYFRVPDIRQAHDALRGRGVEFSHSPHMIHRHADGTEEWMAFFKDPEDRPLAIMSQVKP